jgi:hypothetical protein
VLLAGAPCQHDVAHLPLLDRVNRLDQRPLMIRLDIELQLLPAILSLDPDPRRAAPSERDAPDGSFLREFLGKLERMTLVQNSSAPFLRDPTSSSSIIIHR